MSHAHPQIAPQSEVLLTASPHGRGRLGGWLVFLLVVSIVLWLVSAGISFAIQHSRLPNRFTSRVAAAFGRPVTIQRWDFTLWGGPALNARSIAIEDDPRFGNEYFLRADSMSVQLRWQSLIRGRLEAGSLAFDHLSLNVVRDGAGDWNLAEWLPRPAGAAGATSGAARLRASSSAFRFRRIEIDGGRINFKQGDTKLPVAFVAATGSVEADDSGRWRISLEAIPWRAAVLVQQAGKVYVSGHVGGTSSRLRPAALDISWSDASLSDVLRLARGDDYGIRGMLSLSMNTSTQNESDMDGWAVEARANLRQIHRWDLASRPDNPSLNLFVRGDWSPNASFAEITDFAVEAPHSHVSGAGRVHWGSASRSRSEESTPVRLRFSSGSVDLGDALGWLRAFRPGVSGNLSVRGLASLSGETTGWPPEIASGMLSIDGVVVSEAGLRQPVRVSSVKLSDDRGAVSIEPVTLSWGSPGSAPEGAVQVAMQAKKGRDAIPGWHVTGSVRQMHDLLALADALSLSVPRGWDLDGPMRCDLRFEPWLGLRSDITSSGAPAGPMGWLEVGAAGSSGRGGSIRAPFLNLPVEQLRARVELKPGSVHVALASAAAFGTRWSGSLDRSGPSAEWRFALLGDELAAPDLDRWLNPRWRESLLGRVLPFLNSRSTPVSVLERISATGTVTLGQFALLPFELHRLQSDLQIAGRRIELTNATAEFFGGTLGGTFTADLDATPSYHANLDFSHVGVTSLLAPTQNLANLRAESAAGQLSLDARGGTRADLMSSLTCKGDIRVTGPEVLGFDLTKVLGGKPSAAGSTRFATGSATFSCTGRKIEFQDLTLISDVDSRIEGSGSVDFDRNAELLLQAKPAATGLNHPFRMFGPLSALQIARFAPATPRRSR